MSLKDASVKPQGEPVQAQSLIEIIRLELALVNLLAVVYTEYLTHFTRGVICLEPTGGPCPAD